MGNFCITASGNVTADREEDLHRFQVRSLEDTKSNGKTATVEANQESKKRSLEMCSLGTAKRCVAYEGGDSLSTFTMRPAGSNGKGAQNHKPSKAKATRETVNPSPESSGQSRSKKFKVHKSALENPSQTVKAAGQLNPSHPKHGEAREVTSNTQSTPETEGAKLSGQDCQQCPTRVSDAEDENSEMDLYRGAEEIEQEKQEKQQSCAAPNLEDQNSVAAPESLLPYGEREWKGNTSKSRLIKKGYEAVAQRSYESLRRVRGDNYCALRATLFQILSQSEKLPAWLQDTDMSQWPKQMQSELDLLKQWRFPVDHKNEGGAVEQLECCLKRLRKRWQEAVQCASPEEKEHICQQVFVGQNEEYELLEALKFLMLRTAVQLHSDMEKGSQVPEFCWLLFARDTSKCPRSFFTNHLRHVGFSGGLEQVEMFLLGYSLQQTIQVYRLYKTDTEEFITYYPDDHKKNWPYLNLITEDDRHYNVLVSKQLSSKFSKSVRPIWKIPSGGHTQERHITQL
ncbi:OTU deubiquitinase with linear linkage specificity b [Pygocentrus nattereri]|uniref:OTU deubiquitinase with linear linkage specificity b n=1 Tax=Pygocentrus nattereri TaxID=42514 RepID=UPI0008143F9A|nr:OTU deubiquitinase with linear linkage specificity b [Pygocentrus nattereri]